MSPTHHCLAHLQQMSPSEYSLRQTATAARLGCYVRNEQVHFSIVTVSARVALVPAVCTQVCTF